MVRARRAPGDVLLEQARLVQQWLATLPAAAYEQPSVLPGWEVRTLVAHLLLVHRGLATTLGRPSRSAAVPVAELVRRYRQDVDRIETATRQAAADHPGPELLQALAVAVDEAARALAGPLPRVVETPRGPGIGAEFVATRIVEVVVHADDLSRSLADRPGIELARPALSAATRTLAGILAAQHPGRSVEVRVPPYAAVQCGAGTPGPAHTRGTPPAVVETDPLSFLRLATGRLGWSAALAGGTVRASGLRADLSAAFPLLS